MSDNVSNIIDHNKPFRDSYPAIVRHKMPKINIIGHFSSRMSLKKFLDKNLLDNNLTNLLGNYFSPKNVYNRIITLSKASNSSFTDCRYFSRFKYFNRVFSALKTSNFSLSEIYNMICMFYLSKPEKVIKKC